MIQEITKKFWPVINHDIMRANMLNLSRFHRLQRTNGYHDAAEEALRILRSMGFDAEIWSYPSDGGRCYHVEGGSGGHVMREAWCELCFDGNRRVADHNGMAMSVSDNSGPCPEGEYELLYMDKGGDEKDYEGVDFEGKVLLRTQRTRCDWAYDRGAIGFIEFDNDNRVPHDVLNWSGVFGREDKKPIFGFNVTADVGREIASMVTKLRAGGEKPMVRCYVDSEFTEIPIENVTALIPGETEEEILIVGHLCHPQPSSGDNLSGCIAGMETLRVIKRLLDLGEIAPLKRGIRLMLVPECLGSGAFIGRAPEEHVRRIVAGINLDMVGLSQSGNTAPVTVNETSHAMPSIVGALCSAILNVLREDYHDRNYEYRALYNVELTEFRTASDQIIYCDPMCGIPMPMVGQCPDEKYHNSADDHTHIDYFIMAKSVNLAAAYCCTLANMTSEDAAEIGIEVQKRAIDRVAKAGRLARGGTISRETYDRRIQALDRFYAGMYDDFKRYIHDTDESWLESFVNGGKTAVSAAVKAVSTVTFGTEPVYTDCPLRGGKWDRVLRRIGSGPASDLEYFAKKVPGGMEMLREYDEGIGWDMMYSEHNMVEYFIDGKRTVGEVIDCAMRETYDMRTPEHYLCHIDILEKLGICEEVEAAR